MQRARLSRSTNPTRAAHEILRFYELLVGILPELFVGHARYASLSTEQRKVGTMLTSTSRFIVVSLQHSLMEPHLAEMQSLIESLTKQFADLFAENMMVKWHFLQHYAYAVRKYV